MINGCKLIILSSKAGHPRHRFGFFFGGLFLVLASVSTLFVSALYNDAIATSNSELIFNGVIILFITDLDEMVYDILLTINTRWAPEEDEGEEDTNESVVDEKFRQLEMKYSKIETKNTELGNELKLVQNRLQNICERMGLMQSETAVMKTPAVGPQNEAAEGE